MVPPPRRVLAFGTFDAALHPRVMVLADGLAAHGWEVSALNEPLGVSTAERVRAAGTVGGLVAFAARVVRSWARLARRRRGAGHPDVVLVGYMGHLDVLLARILFRRSTVVLDHLVGLADTARDRRVGSPAARTLLGAVDRLALRAAHVVVVDTEAQRDELPAHHRGDAVVVPVGALPEWHLAGARAAAVAATRAGADPDAPCLRVVFAGLYTPLQGAEVIGRTIRRLRDDPRIHFTMVGSGQDLERTRELAAGGNATWIDWVDASRLPELVAGHDVCLGIFGTGPKAARVVPNKVVCGLAAGCAVVTGDTPAVRRLPEGAALLVPVGDDAALAAALVRLVERPGELSALRRAASAAAAEQSPAALVTGLHRVLTNRSAVTRPKRQLPPLTLNAWLRWDVAGPALATPPGRAVLEIGPGEGAVAARLAQVHDYTGVETSPRTRAATERVLDGLGTPGRLLGSLDDIGAAERFDVVCAFEVLEHLDDHVEALERWGGLLTPGGQLVLSVPAGPRRMGPHDRRAGHLRRYDAAQLADLLSGAGLVDVQVRHVGFPVGYPLEWVRNAAARRSGHGDGDPAHQLPPERTAERTEASSSILQPPGGTGWLTRALSAPGRRLQRLVPGRGTGLVATARRPR